MSCQDRIREGEIAMLTMQKGKRCLMEGIEVTNLKPI